MTAPQDSQPIRDRGLGATATFGLALACVLLLATWAATDASFRLTTWKTRVALRLQSIPSADPDGLEGLGVMPAIREFKWDALGKRVLVFFIVTCLGITATFAACYFTARHFTAIRIVGAATLLVAWTLLYFGQDTIDDSRFRRQVADLLPKFEQAGTELSQNWPIASGEVPPGIKFDVWPEKYPDVLIVRGAYEAYPFRERLGRMITRSQVGVIRFDLAAAFDSCVEYHPNGTVPEAHISGLGNRSSKVASVSPLKLNWYLVRYGGL